MSNISTIFDTFKSKLQTWLPSHVQLTNPYAIDQNTEMALSQGFGIRWGGGGNTNRLVGCQMSVQRTMTVIITRQFYANDLNVVGKETTEKYLMEDEYTIIKNIESDVDLGSSSLAKILFVSDNGIEFVFTEKDNYLKLEITFELEYFENLN
jgi:hypothetical protein